MSGRLKAVTIAVAILYAAGVLFFIVKANSRRNFVAVPDFIERDLAIPSDEFDMLALELDKYIVLDDVYDSNEDKVVSAGELLTTSHMQRLVRKDLAIPSDPSKMLVLEREKHTVARDVEDEPTGEQIAGEGDTLNKETMERLRQSGKKSVAVTVQRKVKVKDQRKIAAFVEKELAAMDDVVGPDGLLLKAGTVLGRDEVDVLHEAGVSQLRAQGFGSIVGLNGTMIAVVLNFLVLTFLLYVFLWKPVVGITDARENTVAAALDSAKEAVVRAEEVQRERSKLDRETRRERMKIIDNLTAEGRREADEMIARARAEAGRLREKAQSALASTVEQLDRELRPELPVLANQVTTKLLGRTLRQELFEQAASRSEPEGGEG